MKTGVKNNPLKWYFKQYSNILQYYIWVTGFQKHRFHLVTRSPWPFFAAVAALSLTVSSAGWFHLYCSNIYVIYSLIFLLCIMFLWWRDIIRESTFLGYHTGIVIRGLRFGMLLFIVSEIMFFFAFFWAFFHASLAPAIVLGSIWPPLGICVLNPLHIPLLNTYILLISGVLVTLSHHCVQFSKPFLICNNKIVNLLLFKQPVTNYNLRLFTIFDLSVISLLFTLFLAIEFTLWQGFEYTEALFYINDGIYGSCFYITTGFHGLHVIIGSIFLGVALFRLISGHLVFNHHFGYEAAIWYWHFVDVVWLFLYIFVYCWSSGLINLRF